MGRAEWERRNECTIAAILPAGTILRVTGIDCATTFDTAEIVPRAVVTDGEHRGKAVGLAEISVGVPTRGYPYPLAPNPKYLDVLADCMRILSAGNASWGETFSIAWRSCSAVLLVKSSSIHDDSAPANQSLKSAISSNAHPSFRAQS